MKNIKDQIEEHAGDALDGPKAEPQEVVARKPGQRGAKPKAPGEKLRQYRFSANDRDAKEIKDAAREAGMDFSTFVRVAVLDYLRRNRRNRV